MSALILISIGITIVGGLVVATFPEADKKKRIAVTFVSLFGACLIVWKLLVSLLTTGTALSIVASIASLQWKLQVDPLGITFAVIASTLWIFAAIYSFGYMAHDQNQRKYFCFFLISAGITLGVAFAGNLFALYLFYELLTFATYPLVIHQGSDGAIKSGNKYIKYSLAGAGLILAGLVLLWQETGGSLDFSTEALLQGVAPSPILTVILLLMIAGFGVKAAMMPLHGWLPSAMVAPTPVSALLHAVAVVNAGVFGILRTVYSVFGPQLVQTMEIRWVLLFLASITIICGSLFALRQDVLKKRLAYSTISQLSYILLGAFTLHPLGLAGAMMHMINHANLKITLFFSAGIIAEETGRVKVSQLKGIGRALPLTISVFGLASLGMVGMLPLSGFWSKYYLMQGGMKIGLWQLIVVLIASGLLNAIYFFPITIGAFRSGERVERIKPGRNTLLMLIPTLILIGVAVLFGIWPGLSLPLVEAVVQQFFNM